MRACGLPRAWLRSSACALSVSVSSPAAPGSLKSRVVPGLRGALLPETPAPQHRGGGCEGTSTLGPGQRWVQDAGASTAAIPTGTPLPRATPATHQPPHSCSEEVPPPGWRDGPGRDSAPRLVSWDSHQTATSRTMSPAPVTLWG